MCLHPCFEQPNDERCFYSAVLTSVVIVNSPSGLYVCLSPTWQQALWTDYYFLFFFYFFSCASQKKPVLQTRIVTMTCHSTEVTTDANKHVRWFVFSFLIPFLNKLFISLGF